jgi:methylmalonyl-CoA mutase
MSKGFTGITKEDIVKTIEHDLKGKSYQSLTHTIGGIDMEPVYTFEETVIHDLSSPREDNRWQIAQYYLVEDPKETNKMMLDELNQGVNALLLDFINIKSWSIELMHQLFQNIYPEYISIHIRNAEGSVAAIIQSWLDEVLSAEKSYEITASFHHPRTKSMGFRLAATEQLQEALQFIDANIDHADKLHFEVEIGANYFLEISKIRALRWLWDKMMAYYNKPTPIYIIAYTSLTNLDKEDVNYNMLRNTTEAMSAVIGGVDVLCVYPFDYTVKTSNEFSRRIAKNVQIILQEESGFGNVKDPSKGAYYIETLTHKLAENAWNGFRQMK